MELKDHWKMPEVARYLDMGPLHEKRVGLNMICRKVKEILVRYPEYTILDIACGPGSVLRRMLHRGVPVKPKQYIGVDYALPAIKRARKHCPEYTFKKLNVITDSLPTADIVICADILQHLENPEVLVDNVFKATNRYCIIGTWAKDNGEDWNQYHISNLNREIPCIHRNFDIVKLESRLLDEWDWKFIYSKIVKHTEYVGVLEKILQR